MLAPEEMTSLRGIARASLPGRCDIIRKERTRLPNGSWKDTTVTVASNIPCRKVPTGQIPVEAALLQTTLGSRGLSTFLIDSAIEVQRTDIVVYPSGVKQYGVAGVLYRTGGEYTRIIVYDDSMAVPA